MVPLPDELQVNGDDSLRYPSMLLTEVVVFSPLIDPMWQLPTPHVVSQESPFKPKAQPLGEIDGTALAGQAEVPQQQSRVLFI